MSHSLYNAGGLIRAADVYRAPIPPNPTPPRPRAARNQILPVQCLVSFGSNLGQRESLIATAAKILAKSELTIDFQASRLFETPPVGGPAGQEPFLNAVATFQTEASAREILGLLQQTEQELGRRRERRWDSRSIDLDVVLHGELVGQSSALIVPHPRYTARKFVLAPACDVAAHYRDPRFGWTLAELNEHLGCGLPSLVLVGGDHDLRSDLLDRLAKNTDIEISRGQPISASTDRPWVSDFLPKLPQLTDANSRSKQIPTLICRIIPTEVDRLWPAPHQIWPASWGWPEYHLEVVDRQWATTEILSALQSMRCTVRPVTADGSWWNSEQPL